ncbi:MAG: cobalt-precorrin-5B (C(1))-methyltransferase CbiD [Thermodesulfobacteriota bacterium]|jgi:cobalt-precorrin-5B (C1)-methyltransferase|nr:cobalt-precorrin-5B (C(1))-methyltransferase CbiD [Thermodesulfobacteriota bacterium]
MGERLRCGFTTGAAAAAAAQAALEYLLAKRWPRRVKVTLLTGESLEIGVHSCRWIAPHTAACSVIKDAGDDPDVTHGAEIGARVTWQAGSGSGLEIRGGHGVGVVTKPGLEIAVGRPAINPGPQKMIREAASQVLAKYGLSGRVEVEVFVPEGEALARKTLNARLGIVGGISILGTTGIVRPMSHEAYTATIRAGLSVARAAGLKRAVLTTGRRSERYAQLRWPRLPEEAFVQIGDYFAAAMEMAADQAFESVMLAVFFGKAVKMAQCIPHTHARSAALTMDHLARWTQASGGDADLARKVAGANTARQVFDLITTDCPALIEKVGLEVIASAKEFGDHKVAVDAVIFGFDGKVWFDSEKRR